MSTAERLDALERENIGLKKRLAALEAQVVPSIDERLHVELTALEQVKTRELARDILLYGWDEMKRQGRV